MIDLNLLGAHEEQWIDLLAKLYPELKVPSISEEEIHTIAKTVTIQVTDDCCMACTYCY